MIRFGRICIALALSCAVFPVAAAEPVPVTAAEIIHSIGMDGLFLSFGNSIAPGPRQSGVTDERFLLLWEEIVPRAFGDAGLVGQLDRDLSNRLDETELGDVAAFLGSELGRRMLSIEQHAAAAAGAQQLANIARGQALLLEMPARRRAALAELLELSGAETGIAVMHESLRALAMALRMSRHGGIEVSFEDADAEITATLRDLDDSLSTAMLGTMAAAYRELGDDELEAYLEVLRRPALREFHQALTLGVGRIVKRTMIEAVQDVVARSRAVNI